jgi:hypothetical protein
MGKKILITEAQLKKLVKYISEEAAGYDDFSQMFFHGAVNTEKLLDNLEDLENVFNGLVSATGSEHITYIDLKETLEEVIDLISEFNEISKNLIQDYPDKQVVKTGEILHRKLESYQDKIMMIFSYPEDTFSLDKLKYKIDDLTDPVLEYVEEFTNVLKKSKKTIINRLNKNEPFRRSNPD